MPRLIQVNLTLSRQVYEMEVPDDADDNYIERGIKATGHNQLIATWHEVPFTELASEPPLIERITGVPEMPQTEEKQIDYTSFYRTLEAMNLQGHLDMAMLHGLMAANGWDTLTAIPQDKYVQVIDTCKINAVQCP